MTRPYSLDLRQRAVSLVEAGQSRRAAARLLDLGEVTVICWTRRHAMTGGCAAKPMGGKRRAVLLHERDWLLARVAAVPDLTVRALRAELAAHGTRVVPRRRVALLVRRVAHLQESLGAAERAETRSVCRWNRPYVAAKRARWKRHQGRVDPARFVFVDEAWAKTNMTRTHGRALGGQRLVAAVPHRRCTTMTFLAALRCHGIAAPCVFDGPINGASFLAWAMQFLLPTLRPGDVVVLDNLGRVRQHGREVAMADRKGRTPAQRPQDTSDVKCRPLNTPGCSRDRTTGTGPA